LRARFQAAGPREAATFGKILGPARQIQFALKLSF
jgi:hypothetical protein